MSEQELTKEQQEEIQKQIAQRKKDWDEFIQRLKDAPEGTVTNAELTRTIDFISEDMDGIIQMVQMLGHNMNVLNHNLNQIMTALRGGQPGVGVNKTKSGIILP